MSTYDKFPSTRIKGWQDQAICGWKPIMDTLQQILQVRQSGRCVIALDCYPGIQPEEYLPFLRELQPDHILSSNPIFLSREQLEERFGHHITEDRVFGRMFYGDIQDWIDPEQLRFQQERIRHLSGVILIHGPGAALLAKPDHLIYADLSRWEIQLRWRAGMSNFLMDNKDEDPLRKFKRGYFLEWRMADKHKMDLFSCIDHFLDLHDPQNPILVPGQGVREGLKQISRQPFRLVPYFDPGVWGGQWMKTNFDLDPAQKNYAWSFDGVPEENALLLDFGNARLQLPAMDLVLYQPIPLLGPAVYTRFGAEFPIRFDLLDTMGGQNLSLQVHPATEYIHRTFGMAYTQDESYYILDAEPQASVYLGVQEQTDPQELFAALQSANDKGTGFEAERFINRFPARKHDHFLIPAGTCHCSGAGTMVLEISATPYIFTFKLWDWGRLGLDGKPRPVHLEHGRHVLDSSRDTRWVKDNLINQIELLWQTPGCKAERTGLHSLEWIETLRYWIDDQVKIHSGNTVHMLNLVDGEEIAVCSPAGAFADYTVHYAETFIVPACVEEFILKNTGKSQAVVICAGMR